MLSNCILLPKPSICEFSGPTPLVAGLDIDAVKLNQQIKLHLNSVPTASGSSFIELNGAKVICSVQGPFASQRGGFNDMCQIDCNVKYALIDKNNCMDDGINGMETNNSSSILENAIKPIICLDKYPKAVISVQVLVIQVSNRVSYYIT